MKARRLLDSELENCEKQDECVQRKGDSSTSIDAATEAAGEMAAKSAVLVEMMEDLEERLRRRMANMSDPAPVYSRKVRQFQAKSRNENDSPQSLSGSRNVEGLPHLGESRVRNQQSEQ